MFARYRIFDAAMHRDNGECYWCYMADRLKAGESIIVTADTIASAVVNACPPEEYDDLRDDPALYAIVGPDTIEAVD